MTHRVTLILEGILLTALLVVSSEAAPPDPLQGPSADAMLAVSMPTPTSRDSEPHIRDPEPHIDEVATLRNTVSQLNGRMAELEKTAAYLNWWTNALITLFALILAVGTAYSVMWGRRAEQRSTESFALLVKGESAGQNRDQEVHTLSQNTLSLVNETLNIAKDAMATSTREVQNREQQALESYEEQAVALVKKRQDDKVFVERPKHRAAIHHLADQIGTLMERQKFSPTALALRITPYCRFVLAMSYHLQEDFERALGLWDGVAVDQATDRELASLAWYWHGYVKNNLGDPSDAQLSFQKALQLTTDTERRYELERIMLETRWFQLVSGTEVDQLLDALKSLHRRLDSETYRGEGLRRRKQRIEILLGNILLVNGNGDREAEPGNALTRYNEARTWFLEAGESELWAQFGLAEVSHRLGDEQTAARCFAEVFNRVIDQYTQRQELRTKVLLRSTQLICAVRKPGLEDQVSGLLREVRDAIGELVQVDENLTVYSQTQKRNIKQSELIPELKEIIEEEGKLRQPLANSGMQPPGETPIASGEGNGARSVSDLP